MQRHPDSSGLEAGDASSRLVNNTTRAGSTPLESLGGSTRAEPSPGAVGVSNGLCISLYLGGEETWVVARLPEVTKC